ncbi:MAG: hypothetical protein VKP62_15945 [Candidatus Sericytochromatia bacterium]|nr:hypothetical protein [Candidatus Sericytochromatia bacterium]
MKTTWAAMASLGVAAWALIASPAEASTAPVADFVSGQALGVGLSGVAWDHGFGRGALGLELRSTTPTPDNYNSRFLAAARGTWRITEDRGLHVGLLGGVTLDPGYGGQRAYLLPDLGVGVAHHFSVLQWPFTLRFNVTLTLDQGQNRGGYPVPYGEDGYATSLATRNPLQRLTLGPNTTISLAYAASDRYEVTLGGGTLLGLRIKY